MRNPFRRHTPVGRASHREQATPRDARVREQLDGLVVNMELTLISIIQGVALFFLIDSSRELITSMRVELWPYIVVGLLTIFLFWSRSLMHTFTVIQWPLEFGHNFIYIACTFAEAVMFTQIAHPERWFLLGAAYSLLVWFLFYFDLEMVRGLRRHMVKGKEELCDYLEADQLLNLRVVMPMLILFNLGAWLALRSWPDVFIARRWHLVFGATQLIGGIVYLSTVQRFYRHIAPLIVQWRE
jgi:hypothetical protein